MASGSRSEGRRKVFERSAEARDPGQHHLRRRRQVAGRVRFEFEDPRIEPLAGRNGPVQFGMTPQHQIP
jgi:hypothetical protein